MPKKSKVSMIIDPTFEAQQDLYDFMLYLLSNKGQRFFQALRNWIGCGFLRADGEDTFFWRDGETEKNRKKIERFVDANKKVSPKRKRSK